MTSNEYDINDLTALVESLSEQVESQKEAEQAQDNVHVLESSTQPAENVEQEIVNGGRSVDGSEAVVASDADTADEQTSESGELDTEKLSASQQEMVRDLDEALKNIALLSDKEIKAIYKDLKVKFYADPSHKKTFKKYKKNIKGAIKSDKKRTKYRYLTKGKYLPVLAAVYGFVLAMNNNAIVLQMKSADETVVDFIGKLVELNWQAFNDYVPSSDVQVTIGAFALGIALYAGGKTLVKMDDIKTMRKLMIQALGEDMSMSEINALKTHISRNKHARIKEAADTYPLRDFGKSPETLAQERFEALAREQAEAEKKQAEEKSVQKHVKHDDEMQL